MKKLLSIALVVVLLAGIAVSGTMAYLQDTDSDVNVMTLGKVSIEQHEYERVVDEKGNYETKTIDDVTSYVLKDFTQGKALLPATEVDANGQPYNYGAGNWDDTVVRMTQVKSYGGMQVFTSKNAQDKFVTVENTGRSDAYVRTLIAFEIGSLTAAEFDNVISTSSFMTDQGVWKVTDIGIVEIDGNNYFVSEYLYNGAKDLGGVHENGILPAGDTTYPSLCQVYMKSNATNDDVEKIDGNKNGTYDILVLSQAVQTAGFENATVALTAGFGAATADNVKDWFEGSEAKVPVLVESQDALKKAIADGEKNILVTGAELTGKLTMGTVDNATFVNCKITGTNNEWSYANNATFQNCTFDSGAANPAIHFDKLYGELVVNNCTFKSGKVQIGNGGDATAEFNNCTFGETTETSIWSEKGMRFYCPTEFNNCEFNNRVVLAGSNGLALTFNKCTMNGGTPVYYVDNTDGIIRGGNVPTVTIK